jgi:hypothetical protein
MSADDREVLQERLRRAEDLAAAAAGDVEAATTARAAALELRQERAGLLDIAAAAERFLRAAGMAEDLSAPGAALEQALAAQFPEPNPGRTRWWISHAIDAARLVPASDLPEIRASENQRRYVRGANEERDAANLRATAWYQQWADANRAVERAQLRAAGAEARAQRLIGQMGAAVADAAPDLGDWLAQEAAPRRPDRSLPPAEMILRLDGYIGAARYVIAGLQGRPFSWRGVDGQHELPRLAAMGVTLVSKSHAERLGYRLKKNAQPVGERYFQSPISRAAFVYVLECQCVPADPEETKKAEAEL